MFFCRFFWIKLTYSISPLSPGGSAINKRDGWPRAVPRSAATRAATTPCASGGPVPTLADPLRWTRPRCRVHAYMWGVCAGEVLGQYGWKTMFVTLECILKAVIVKAWFWEILGKFVTQEIVEFHRGRYCHPLLYERLSTIISLILLVFSKSKSVSINKHIIRGYL